MFSLMLLEVLKELIFYKLMKVVKHPLLHSPLPLLGLQIQIKYYLMQQILKQLEELNLRKILSILLSCLQPSYHQVKQVQVLD